MKSGAIDDLNTRQLRAYESFEAMDAWGLLRGSKEPCSAMQVAERLGLSLQVAQAALDVAEAAELVQKLPAGKGRRSITYQSVTDELVVELADGSTDEGRTAIDAWMMMGARHQEAILHRMVPVNRRAPKGDRFMTYATELRASKEDSDELLRRVVAVNRFVDEILDRMQDPAYASDGVYGPHAYFMRIAPIRGEIREAPLIKIHSRGARELVRGGRHDAPRTLTRREREIAVLLQRGLSRAEVAARLRVSVDTVSSHCKQLFKKLGVKRATELGRFSFESRDGAAQGGDANR